MRVHELGITRNIVAIVSEHAGEQRVKRVEIDIGKLAAIMPDAIRFCFDVVSEGTLLEKAALEINEIPGLGRCEECGSELELKQLFGQCKCGCKRISCIAGEEMNIKEIEVY